MTHTVLVSGAGGQLGWELLRTVPGDVQVIGLSRAELDITDANAVNDCLARHKPAVWVNAAAYTAVDKAESEVDAAMAANAVAPGVIAAACAHHGARLIHVSTDFVFDGSASQPYSPDDATGPLGVYGQSKLEGERAVIAALPESTIFRTGWVYSAHGGNFVKTMLRLMAERDALSVVDDQVGTPTWANGLAHAVWAAAKAPHATGIFHWSDAGVCSWYDFAVAIEEEARALALLGSPTTVAPISAADYPTPASRPAYSVLDKHRVRSLLQLPAQHWRSQLRAMLNELKELNNA